mmetsp:Transcript_25216/g.27951  ORF Transcript_25216/g.27951 Transcript_25216/m.27951 type:complete len:294 (-) Transcript_25216:336-1217(-)
MRDATSGLTARRWARRAGGLAQDVGRTSTRVCNDVFDAVVDECSPHVLRGISRVLGPVLSCKTGNVRTGHGSPGNGSRRSGAANPAREHVSPRSEDVHAGSEVGEARASVAVVRRTNSERPFRSGGRKGARRSSAVASCSNQQDARGGSSIDGVVGTIVLATSEGHGRNFARPSVVGNVVDPSDGHREASASPAHDFDVDKVSVASNTERATTNGASAVGPVAVEVTILLIAEVRARRGAALEVLVLNEDSSVKDVHGDIISHRTVHLEVAAILQVGPGHTRQTPEARVGVGE